MPDIIKFPNLTNSILKSLELPKECKTSCKKEGEYIVDVNIDDWQAATICVNENTYEIQLSFNYDTDPVLVAHIALTMGGYAQMDIYESYRICPHGEILWWNDEKNGWFPAIENCDCRPSDSTDSTVH